VLLQRLVTALVLIPLVIGGVLYLPTASFSLLFGLVVLYAGWEWGSLATLPDQNARVLFLLLLTTALGGVSLLLDQDVEWGLRLSAAATAWWLLVMVWLARYQPDHSYRPGPLMKALIGLIVLVPFWSALVVIHGSGEDGPMLVLFLMILIWVADSGAYFTGRRWGRVKLAPRISPGKTREGVYGALVGAAICGGLLAWIRPETGQPLLLVLFCVVVALVSVFGDLFESLLKRLAGVKDSGRLLPGHGGMLDRIDSLTAAAPVFLSGLTFLGGEA
jgi:phosphatidate cytidylyltransferase